MRTFLTLLALVVVAPLLSASGLTPSMVGTWQAYNELHGEVTQRLPLQYIFGELGWGIKEGNQEVKVQDWYQVREEHLLLRPGNVSKDFGESAVIKAPLLGKTFRLPDPLNPNRTIRFEALGEPKQLSIVDLVGTYRLEQRRLGTQETREAPYRLQINEKAEYRLIPTPEIETTYDTGHVRIEGDTFTLEPREPSEDFWNQPTFFLYQKEFRYNHPTDAIRLLRQE